MRTFGLLFSAFGFAGRRNRGFARLCFFGGDDIAGATPGLNFGTS